MNLLVAIGFAMTDKCNAACRICCFSCNPENSRVLNKELIKDYIRQAAEMGLETIAFTGGEAMLYYDLLLECITCAQKYGMKSSLVSNGFWAANEEKGTHMIKTLHAAGLAAVSFSVDAFHQEFVPYETVKTAMKICEDLGILSFITIMDVKDGRHLDNVTDNFREILYNKPMGVYPVFPVGSAEETVPPGDIIREYIPEEARCPFDQSFSIFFDGDIRMCCSQFSPEIDMVRLGNFSETPLKEAIDNFNRNDFIYVLLKNDFKWYITHARTFGIEIKEKYSVPCEMCRDLFTNADFVKNVTPLVKKEADRLRLATLFG